MTDTKCESYAQQELLLLQNILAYMTSSAEDTADIKKIIVPVPVKPEEVPNNKVELDKKVEEILSGIDSNVSGGGDTGHEFKSIGWTDPVTGKLYTGEIARKIISELEKKERLKASSNGISNQDFKVASSPEIAIVQNLKAIIDILSHLESVICGSNVSITKYL